MGVEGLAPGERLLLMVLAARSDERWETTSSGVATVCGVDARTTRRWFAQLSEKGLVGRGERVRDDAGRMGEYTLILNPRDKQSTSGHQRTPMSGGEEIPANDQRTPVSGGVPDFVKPLQITTGHLEPRARDVSNLEGSSLGSEELSVSSTSVVSTNTPLRSPLTAQTIIAAFIDSASAAGVTVPRRTIGMLARSVKELLDEGVPAEAVTGGLTRMVERRIVVPSSLANFVLEAQLRTGNATGVDARGARRYGHGMTPAQVLARYEGLE